MKLRGFFANFIIFYQDLHCLLYTSSHQKLELLQYNACIAITGAIRGTSREKLYEELGLESLQLRRWFRKLSLFYKLFNSEHPNYLFKLIPLRSSNYVTRNIHNIHLLKTRHTFFKNSFFPLTIIEWNKLDHKQFQYFSEKYPKIYQVIC